MNERERAGRYSDLFGTGSDHQHADSNCAYCPICAAIGVLRNTKPEVLDHLANAAREMIIVAGLLLDEAEKVVGTAEGPSAKPDEGGPKVRRIDIS
jgi:hypothetical protein